MMVRLTGSLSLAVVLGACGSGPNPPPAAVATEQVQVLYRGIRCPATQPSVRLIRDAASWAEWQRQRQQMIFVPSDEPADVVDDLNFVQVSVVVISMGQKPTTLYAVDVPEGSVTLQATSLTISAIWQRPPEGAILPQVITSPCIAITVPNAPYSTVNIKNQDGDIVISRKF